MGQWFGGYRSLPKDYQLHSKKMANNAKQELKLQKMQKAKNKTQKGNKILNTLKRGEV